MDRRWEGQSGANETRSAPPIYRGFRWTYRGRQCRVRLRIPMWHYAYYHGRPRVSDYSVYVVDPFADDILTGLATKIDEYAQKNRLSDNERIAFIAAFVQQLEYVPDDVSTPYEHYPRYPIETLVHRGGDCEDVSILLAALLRRLGYDAVLINPPEHIQVGVGRDPRHPGTYYKWNKKRYYVLEATGEDWTVGETPPEFIETSAKVIPLSKTPVLVHRWSARVTDEDDIIGQLAVTNLGDRRASDITGDVEFRTSDGVTAGSWSGSIAELNAGRTHVFELSVQLTHPDPIRGKARVTVLGESWDQSSSLVTVA